MKVIFWLLDVNSEVKDGAAEIWLWGIDDSGKRVLVIDRSFVPYFYAVIKEGTDPENVVQEIDKRHHDSVAGLEVVDRRFFGKPVKAVKVSCKNPDTVSSLAAGTKSKRRQKRNAKASAQTRFSPPDQFQNFWIAQRSPD